MMETPVWWADDGRAVNVIQEIFPSPGAELIVRHGGIAIVPGSRAALPCQTHQGAEQAELGPADIHGGLGNAEVPAEIAAPIGIAAGGQVKNSGHDGPQPVEVGPVVSGELADPFLRAGRGPSAVQDEIVPTLIVEHLADGFLIIVVVIIVHLGAALAVIEDGVFRRAIAEIHHAAGHAEVEVRLPPSLAKLQCVRVGEVDVVERVGPRFRRRRA